MSSLLNSLPLLGWREYLALPALGIPRIKAKIDTGARSSTLHAFDIKYQEENGLILVYFKVHPYQQNHHYTVFSQGLLLERREIRNSGGHKQLRPVIRTTIILGQQQWEIDLSLTNRDQMGFRMLLGREAIRRRFLVDTGRSYLQNFRSKKARTTPS